MRGAASPGAKWRVMEGGGVMEEKKNGSGGAAPLTSSQSVSLSLSVTGPLCFLLMNSLVSVLKRTARVPFVPEGGH